MSLNTQIVFRKRFLVGALVGAALLTLVPPVQARVTRIIFDATGSLSGQDIAYETPAFSSSSRST